MNRSRETSDTRYEARAMKTLLRIVGGVLACLVLLLVVLSITGLEPHDKIPGLWLDRGSRYHSGYGLVVHRQISHHRDPDADAVSASSLDHSHLLDL